MITPNLSLGTFSLYGLLASFLTLALIYLAPHLPYFLVIFFLLLVTALSLGAWGKENYLRVRYYQRYFFSLFFVLLFSFIFTSFFFSDDAIRHIYDGFYLVSGIDIYSQSPDKLQRLFLEKPNHSSLPSIYFPVTQIQAYLGALLFDSYYGFRFVYLFVCASFILGLWFLAKKEERTVLLEIFYSPFFLLFISSHHADLQAFLIILFISFCLARKFKTRFIFVILGFLVASLLGTKPEGTFFAFALSIYFLGSNPLTVLFFYILGFCVSVLWQALFVYYILFPSYNSFLSFLDTSRYFMDWFLGYNPILEIRVALYEGTNFSRPNIFYDYRKNLVSIFILLFSYLPSLVLFPFFKLMTFRIVSKKEYLEKIFLGILFFFFFFKGVWHPWYLLWLISFFCVFSKTPPNIFIGFFICAIPLFYIPVVFLRVGKDWQMGMYLFYAVLCTFMFFWLVKKTWQWKKE